MCKQTANLRLEMFSEMVESEYLRPAPAWGISSSNTVCMYACHCICIHAYVCMHMYCDYTYKKHYIHIHMENMMFKHWWRYILHKCVCRICTCASIHAQRIHYGEWSMSVPLHVCIHVYIYVYMHIHTCIHNVCIYIMYYVYIHVCTHVINIYTYIHIYIYIYTDMNIQWKHTHIRTHRHTYTHRDKTHGEYLDREWSRDLPKNA
jgi:hypothetical protein